MLSLQPEVQLDILKFLNFEQLFSLKQANFHFRNLINKYEGGLARMEVFELSLIDAKTIDSQDVIIKLEPVVSDFVLDEHHTENWETALDKSIPLFLHAVKEDRKNFAVQLKKTDKKSNYILKLPNTPKTIEEMIIIRFWLEQLFNCAFKEAEFDNIIFNPEILNLLFDNDKTALEQFHVGKSTIQTRNEKFQNFLNFGLTRFAIYEVFSFFDKSDIPEQYTDILFNIIINEGSKFPHVCLGVFKSSKLYDRIIEYITTSKDLSKMVPFITLFCHSFDVPKLPEKAEKAKIDGDSTKYKIVNVYNPKVKFLFLNCGTRNFFFVYIEKKIEE
uniref:F-box domain-containing protein n=1 Tax=Meloidogyne enterolobii TaxID=390850 RepID=A0A6V7U115_MELEN|nr:unnamed protein product [Meloidogyne enterolobii]